MVSLGTPVYVSVRALTNHLGPDIAKGLSGSNRTAQRYGESLGAAFSKGFSRGVDVNAFHRVANGINSMVPGAEQARKSFATLVRTSYTLGTALTGIVGGASAAVSAIGALGGAAIGAASTMSVLGNAIFALGAGFASVKLATSGIGGALNKLKQQTSSAAAANTRSALQAVRDSQARELAARRVEDAERALARVIEANRDRLIDANQDVADAQNELNAAIRAGREELQQLGFAAEDAAINEQRAAIELERARETLARVQDLPPNSRARREAELAYAEAELNYRKAKDANADLAKEQDRLAKSGVNGLDSVVDARDALAEAEVDRSKTIIDALRDQEDAERNLAEAKADAANVDDRQDAAGAGPAAGVAAAGAAWDEGLNAAQRKFALFINSLQPQFDELSRIASEAFLPKLQTAIQTLMDKAYPVVAVGIGVVASAMGDAAISLADVITEGQNLDKLATLFDSSAVLIRLFGESLGSVYDILMSILTGVAPLAEEFFGWLNDELQTFADHLNSPEGKAELIEFFDKAAYSARLFGDIFGNVMQGIGGIINANIGPGTGGAILLEYFKTATADWGSSTGMNQFFIDVANNATSVFDAVGELVDILGRLGTNENIGKAFDVLVEHAPALENILQTTINAAPQLAELVGTITEIVSALADTGAMQVFFETLNNILTPVLDFVKDPANKEFLDYWGRVFAMFSAVGFVLALAGTGIKITAGILTGVLGPIGNVVNAGKGLAGMFSKIKPKGLGDDLLKVGDDFDKTGKKKDGFIDNLKTFDGKMKETGGKTGIFRGAIAGIGTAFAPLGGVLARVGGGFAALGRGLMGVMLGPVGIVIGVIAALVGLFMLLYNTNDQFKKDMDKVWADLSKTFADAGAQIMEALQPLIPVFMDIVDAIVPLITTLVTALVPIITTLVSAIVPLVTILITALVPVFSFLADLLAKAVPIIASVLTVIIQVLAGILTVVVNVLTAVIVWIIGAITGFGENWSNFWDGIFQFFSDVWDNIVNFVEDAVQFLVDIFLNWTIYGIIIKNWEAIVQFFSDVWANIMGFFDAAFKWIDQYVIQPMILAFQAVGEAFEVVGAFIGDVWKDIQDAIDKAYRWIDANVFKPIRDAIAMVQLAFQTAGLLIQQAWKTMQDALSNAWKWIDEHVFNPIKYAVGLVQQAFENVAEGVRIAWDGIKKAAASPINFVIDTVYNNGLLPFWNNIADALNLKDLKLKRANSIAFASGGVMPGYSPGKDIHKFYSPTGGYLHLSGGEAIMRPEWTRAVGGPAAVERMNRAARRGQAFASGGVYSAAQAPVRRFASGGVLDFVGDTIDNLAKMSKVVADFFADPVAAVKKNLIDGVIKPLTSGSNDSMFQKLVNQVPVSIANNIGNVVKGFFGSAPSARGGGSGMGWQAMWNIAKAQFPNATLNSAYRPGARTVNGGQSYHSLGRAIDLPARMDIFNWLKGAFPNSKELIFSPAGARQLLNGREHLWTGAVKAQHYNHVHWAMANGGTVYPTRDGSIVRVAEAGKPERVEPLDPNGLSDRDKAMIEHLAGGGRGDTTIYVTQLPNEDGEQLARRISQLISSDMRMGATI